MDKSLIKIALWKIVVFALKEQEREGYICLNLHKECLIWKKRH